jgi:hypothetical protein
MAGKEVAAGIESIWKSRIFMFWRRFSGRMAVDIIKKTSPCFNLDKGLDQRRWPCMSEFAMCPYGALVGCKFVIERFGQQDYSRKVRLNSQDPQS